MLSIKDLMSKRTKGPYEKPIRARIVGKYINTISGKVDVQLADTTSHVKCTMNIKEADNFKTGETILLRGFRIAQHTLIVTPATRVTKCSKLDISESIRLSAESYILTDSPATLTIKQIRDAGEDDDRLTTVMAIVENDEAAKLVGNNNIPLRHIGLKDESGSIGLNLWRELAASKVKSGDKIEVSFIRAKYDNFKRDLKLDTTPRSIVKNVTEHARTCTIKMLGIDCEELLTYTVLVSINDDYKTLTCSKRLLHRILNIDNQCELLQAIDASTEMDVLIKGNQLIGNHEMNDSDSEHVHEELDDSILDL